jgi:hypothetical protein
MKKHIRTRALVFVLLSALGLSQTNCGLILHPERNGRHGGRVDVVAIILDCLWLIPGIVPGLVALLIDVVTGGLYEGAIKHLLPGDPIGLRFHGPAPKSADVSITLSSPDGSVRTLTSRHVEQGEEMDSSPVRLPEEMAPGKYGLSISVNGRENGRFAISVQ